MGQRRKSRLVDLVWASTVEDLHTVLVAVDIAADDIDWATLVFAENVVPVVSLVAVRTVIVVY